MLRIMARPASPSAPLSLLEGALLGLLHDLPRSGYALRKVFQDTAMLRFSDSPGSIYPALKRLEARGLVSGAVEAASTLRPRQVFTLTDRGAASLRSWLAEPITRDTVIRSLDGAMLRFAFLDRVLGAAATLHFLDALATQLSAHVRTLDQFHRREARALPLSAALALESGLESYRAQLKWARRAARHFRRPRAAGRK
jgi:DNA-binding PadR family transcriptional regulator